MMRGDDSDNMDNMDNMDNIEMDRIISARLREELAELYVRDEWASEMIRQMVDDGVERTSGADEGLGNPVSRTRNWRRRCQSILNAELEIPLPAIVTAGAAVVATALIVATSWQMNAVRPSVHMWRVSESHHGMAVIVQEVAIKL